MYVFDIVLHEYKTENTYFPVNTPVNSNGHWYTTKYITMLSVRDVNN